jgi:hypothetical protein
MSLLAKLTAGLRLRTSTPSYEAGDELTAYVTGTNEGTPQIRIGDTVLKLTDGELSADASLVDATVRVRVASFDDASHRGSARLLEVVTEPE